MRHRAGKRSAHRVNAEPSDSDSLGISVIFPDSQSQFSRAIVRKAECGWWFGREDPDSEILGLMDHHSRPCHSFDSSTPYISGESNNRYLMSLLSGSRFCRWNPYFPSFKSALTATKLSGWHSRNDVLSRTCGSMVRYNTYQKLSHADATNLHELEVETGR